MTYRAKRSLSTRIVLWIALGMLGGLAAGITHGIFYPSRPATTISLVVVCAIGSTLALARYIVQRRREQPAAYNSSDAGGGDDANVVGR